MMRLLALAIIIGCFPSVALTHGDAAWIQADSAYKDLNGTHCCGVADCEPVAVETISFTRDGWTFLTEGGPFFFPHGAKNLYQTADREGGRPFICWKNIHDKPLGPRCAFWSPGSS